MSVPVSWVLGSGGTLALAITYLAKLIHTGQQKQIDLLRDEIKEMREVSRVRSETILSQNKTIEALQDDIKDLKRGCGHDACLFVKK